jgi:hypothetical protein
LKDVGMKKAYIIVATLLWELCCVTTCSSQTTYAFGVGTDSCGDYVSHITGAPGQSISRTAPDKRDYYSKSTVYLEWLLGFLTGYNAAVIDTTKQVQVDVAAIDSYVRSWCTQNPSSNIFTAVHHFLETADP